MQPFFPSPSVSQLDALKASEWEDNCLHIREHKIPLEHLQHRSATLGHLRHNSLLPPGSKHLCDLPGLPLLADTIDIVDACRGLG